MTALLAKIVYDALHDKDVHRYEKKARVACIALPIILMIIMAATQANGLCYTELEGGSFAYFNSGCTRPGYETYFYLMCLVPCCLLGLITITYIVLIKRKRRQLEFSHSNSIDHQLALIICQIPAYNFIIYIVNVVLAIVNPEVKSVPVLLAHQLPFLMPVLTTITVVTYKKYMVKYN